MQLQKMNETYHPLGLEGKPILRPDFSHSSETGKEKRKRGMVITLPENLDESVAHPKKILNMDTEEQNKLFYILILTLISLNLADLVTTMIGVSLGLQEMNPIIRTTIEQGHLNLVLAKTISTMFIIFLLYITWHLVKKPTKPQQEFVGSVVILVTTSLLCMSLLLININNIIQIIRVIISP